MDEMFYKILLFNSISIKELEKADFDFFKNGWYLKEENGKIVDYFYNILYDSSDKVPFYHCLPIFNTIANDKSFRYMLVYDENNNVAFFTYKIIQIVKTKQIRVFDIPISFNNDDNYIKKIYELLRNKPFVKFAMSEFSTEKFNVSIANKVLVEYSNYYYTRQATNKITNRKLKHWGIKILQDNKDFNVALLDKISEKEIENILKDFNLYLIERGSEISAKDNKDFSSFCHGHKNIKLLCIYYKKELISVTVLCVFGKVAYNLYQKDKKHYDTKDEVLNKMLKYYMEQKTKYLCFMYLPEVERVYILGCMPSEKRLIAHKEMVSDGKIKYYII